MTPDQDLNPSDADRLAVLDRLDHRIPELDLAQHSTAWTTLPDGSEALLVDGGGLDGGNGIYFANAGDDLHAVGSLAPATLGCVVIRPDRSRVLARVVPDPLAQEPDS